MDLKSMISGYNSFLRLLIVLLLMTASYCFGRVQQDSDIANLTAEVTEGVANKEIKAIYELLSASAFTARANMNLAAKLTTTLLTLKGVMVDLQIQPVTSVGKNLHML